MQGAGARASVMPPPAPNRSAGPPAPRSMRSGQLRANRDCSGRVRSGAPTTMLRCGRQRRGRTKRPRPTTVRAVSSIHFGGVRRRRRARRRAVPRPRSTTGDPRRADTLTARRLASIGAARCAVSVLSSVTSFRIEIIGGLSDDVDGGVPECEQFVRGPPCRRQGRRPRRATRVTAPPAACVLRRLRRARGSVRRSQRHAAACRRASTTSEAGSSGRCGDVCPTA